MSIAPAQSSRRPPIGVVLGVALLIAASAGGFWFLRTRAADAAEKVARTALEQQEVILVANGAHVEVLNSAKPIDDAVFALIADLGHLHTCILSGGQATDSQMQVVGRLPRLITLQIDHSAGVTSQGLSHLTGLTSLQKLFANNTGIDDAGLAHLQNFRQLNTLDVSYTKITDEGLKHLTSLPKLEVLRIVGTNVTDAGVESLKAMPALKQVSVANTQITPAGAKTLRGAINGLTVEEQEQGGR